MQAIPERDGSGGTSMIYVVYFLLATPVEFLAWLCIRRPPQAGWLLFLNCGPYVEAAVILTCMAVLRTRDARRSSVGSKNIAGGRFLLLSGAAAAAIIASLLWSYFFSWAYRHFAQPYFIPAPQPWSVGFYSREIAAVLSYYRFFSIFIAFYLAIVAADLLYRNLKDDRLVSWALPGNVKSAGNFVWVSWVTWLVLYRLSEWILPAVALISRSSEPSLDASYLTVLPLIATSVACIPVSFWLYRHRPKTRKSAIRTSQIASFLIPVLATPLLLPEGFLIFVAIGLCLVTLNVTGFAWGWIVGALRWPSLELQ